MYTANIAMPLPTRDARRWYSVDWPKTLVVFVFAGVVITILALGWLRHRIANLPEPGHAVPQFPEGDEPAQPPNPEPRP